MGKISLENITIDKIWLPSFQGKQIEVSVLRLDKIHPVISGNKFFKLKYHLQHVVEDKYEGILTLGGAWSNHIIASACAASLYQLKSVGIIGGKNPLRLSKPLIKSEKIGLRLNLFQEKN